MRELLSKSWLFASLLRYCLRWIRFETDLYWKSRWNILAVVLLQCFERSWARALTSITRRKQYFNWWIKVRLWEEFMLISAPPKLWESAKDTSVVMSTAAMSPLLLIVVYVLRKNLLRRIRITVSLYCFFSFCKFKLYWGPIRTRAPR